MLIIFLLIEFDNGNPDLTCNPPLFPYFQVVSSNSINSDILAPTFYWPMIESSLGVVGACLPALGPLFQCRASGIVNTSDSSMLPLDSFRSNRSRYQFPSYTKTKYAKDDGSIAAITNITGRNW